MEASIRFSCLVLNDYTSLPNCTGGIIKHEVLHLFSYLLRNNLQYIHLYCISLQIHVAVYVPKHVNYFTPSVTFISQFLRLHSAAMTLVSLLPIFISHNRNVIFDLKIFTVS
jgi:hypothetical protein